MNRLKTRLLVTATAIAVLGTSAQAAELVQKDDAPVTPMILMAQKNITWAEIAGELAQR